jgi:hypothetical protein
MLDETAAAPLDPETAAPPEAAPPICCACEEPIDGGPVVGTTLDGKRYHLGKHPCVRAAVCGEEYLTRHAAALGLSPEQIAVIVARGDIEIRYSQHAIAFDGAPLTAEELQQETRAPAYPELAPEAPNGEGGPLALTGDPPGSTNTAFRHGVAIVSDGGDSAARATADLLRAQGHDVVIVPQLPRGMSQEARDALMEVAVDQADTIAAIRESAPHATVAIDPAGVPPPPTVPAEPKIQVAKGLILPVSVVKTFFNPTCRLSCKQGVAPGGRLCYCAIKNCRDAAQRMRAQSREQARAARPAPVTTVREGSLEAIAALEEQLAEVEKEMAGKRSEHAASIAHEEAEALTGERLASQAADLIAEAEERRTAIVDHIAAAKARIVDLDEKIGAARVQEAAARAQIERHRATAQELRGRTARGVAGLENQARKLRTRIDKKLAYQPAVALAPPSVVEPAPAPTDAAPPESPAAAGRNLCAHGVVIGEPCLGCEAVEAARAVVNVGMLPLPEIEPPVDPALPPAYLVPATPPGDPPPEVLSDAGAQG